MYAYKKIDSDIPRMQAIWFSDVLNFIEEDSNFQLTRGNVVTCSILISIFILCLFK